MSWEPVRTGQALVPASQSLQMTGQSGFLKTQIQELMETGMGVQ